MTGAPVIPVGIHLDRSRIRLVETMIEGKIAVGTWYLRGPYAMTVGKPLVFKGDVEDRAHVAAVSERIMQRIVHLSWESARRMQRKHMLSAGPVADAGELAVSI
jgi:1-acyl-sn-glycerol-3-phosphate acyltransferase